jgi:tetratricopeptide (TPR) repeat protein
MAIKGSLKEASLTDVLQLLAMGGKTGCLSVTDRQSFGYIYFDEGRIVYSSLLNRRDRLGDILVREGAVTREQLDQALEEQSNTRDGRRIGEILCDRESLSPKTLKKYVRHQIEEAVYHLFTWSQGTFYFEPNQRPEREEILVSIDPESLLLEGARRVDEWSQIEKKIQSLDVIFSLDADKSVALSSLKLTPEQETVLEYLDGKHSGWAIIDESALGEFEVGKALFGLASAGLIRKTGRQERQRPKMETKARVDEHRNLGVAFYRTGMFDEAVRELKQVIELEPSALDAEFYLGLIELRSGKLSVAESIFRAILEKGGSRAGVFNNLAHVLAGQGRTLEALALLEEGIKRSENSPKLHLSKALLELKTGDPAAAKTTLEDYEKLEDARLTALYYSTKALAQAMSANMDAAIIALEEGLESHPNSAALANNAGVIWERKGDEDRARQLYERAFDSEPDIPQVSKNVADLLYREGNYDEAAEIYERAIRADADLGDDIYAKLGNVYYKSRAREKAIEMWLRALELNPENEVVRTNLEFVKDVNGG